MRVPTSVSPYSASTPFDIFYFSVFRPNENYKRYRGQYNYRDKFEPTNKFQRRVASLREKKKKKNYNWIEGNEKLAEVAFTDEMFRETESATSSRVTYTYFIYIYIYIFSFVSRPLYYRNPMKTLWKFETRRDGVGQLREVNTRRSVRNYERSVASTVLDDTKRFISNLFRKSRRHLDTFNLPR